MIEQDMPFKRLLMEEAEDKNSRLIFNLDISLPIHEEIDQTTLVQTAVDVIEEIDDLIAGVTVNRSFGDAVGLFGVKQVIERFDVPFIADYNLCDVDRNVLWMASELYEAGFKAITLPAFIDEEPILAIQDEFPGQGIILTLSLAHEKKSWFMEKTLKKASELANQLKVDGVNIAGNHPEELKKANKLIEDDMVILCNGFEEGDASPGDCLKEKTNFEVIGRNIYKSKDARETTIKLIEEQRGNWEYDL